MTKQELTSLLQQSPIDIVWKQVINSYFAPEWCQVLEKFCVKVEKLDTQTTSDSYGNSIDIIYFRAYKDFGEWSNFEIKITKDSWDEGERYLYFDPLDFEEIELIQETKTFYRRLNEQV